MTVSYKEVLTPHPLHSNTNRPLPPMAARRRRCNLLIKLSHLVSQESREDVKDDVRSRNFLEVVRSNFYLHFELNQVSDLLKRALLDDEAWLRRRIEAQSTFLTNVS